MKAGTKGIVSLKLNGKPFDLHPPSPTAMKAMAYLDKSAPDELMTTVELARAMGVSKSSLERFGVEMKPFCHVVGPRKLWGNAKAITELRRQLEVTA